MISSKLSQSPSPADKPGAARPDAQPRSEGIKTLIVGAEWAGKAIAHEIVKKGGREIAGFVDDHASDEIHLEYGGGELKLPVLGASDRLYEIAKNTGVAEVVIAVAHSQKDHLLAEIIKCHEHGIRVHQMPDLYAELAQKIPVKHIGHEWIIPRLKAPSRDFYSFLTYAIDYGVSLTMLLLVFFPLFPFIAAAIKLSSPGPLYFYQKRVGLNGRRFTILKFRTMTDRARKQGAAWTTSTDPRITWVGRIIRKFRIDELPQLINILKGDMALIGPRPEAVELVAKFKKEIPFYEYRYLVKPGITGWAQVNYANTCSVEGALEKFQYDLYWIKKKSILMNFRIMLMSVRVVLTGYGAV